jgi:hypothetical protein
MLKRLSLPFHSNSTSDLPAQLYTDHPQPSPYSLTPELSSNGYFPHSGPPSPAVLPGTDLPCNNALSIERPALNKSLRCLELRMFTVECCSPVDSSSHSPDCFGRVQTTYRLAGSSSKEDSKDFERFGQLFEGRPAQAATRSRLRLYVPTGIRSCALTRADNTLTASASLFEAVAEVDAKFAKIAQKTFDNANEVCGKSFKKIAVSSLRQAIFFGLNITKERRTRSRRAHGKHRLQAQESFVDIRQADAIRPEPCL